MKKIWTLFQKEILDIIRDKKTLIMMILVPILLYPLLMIGISLVISAISANQIEKEYVVAFCNISEDAMREMEAVAQEHAKDIEYHLSFVSDNENCEEKLTEKQIDAFIKEEINTSNQVPAYKICYLSAVTDSQTAAAAISQILGMYQEKLRLEELEKYQLDESVMYPITYEKNDLSSMEESLSVNMGGAIGLLIIMTIFMGAIYPTIDVTAGEKERGTLETLLTLPVTNFQLITSKFLAVALIACVTAVLSILSLGGSVGFMIFQFSEMLSENGIQFRLEGLLPAVGILLILMLTLALFMTAVCMAVCLFAKSFKEANNYITPVMLVMIFGAYPAMLPSLELTQATALIPVLNVVLTVKQLFGMQFNFALYGIVFFSNLTYSLLIIWVLARMYKSETVLFAEGFTSFQLFHKRSDMKSGTLPKVGDSFLLLCVELLLILYAGTAATIKLGFGGIVVQQLIILACPLLFAWYMKADFKQTFSLHPFSVKSAVGSIFVWLGAYPALLLFSAFLSWILPSSAENVEAAFQFIDHQPVWLLLFVIALLPAVGEELLFRGFFYNSIKGTCKPIAAMLIVSAVFGLYHMSLIKFFSTTLLGLVLILVARQTGSIFCSMLMHFLNNAMAVFLMKYPQEIGKVFPMLLQDTLTGTDVVLLLFVSVSGLLIGYFLLRTKKKVK